MIEELANIIEETGDFETLDLTEKGELDIISQTPILAVMNMQKYLTDDFGCNISDSERAIYLVVHEIHDDYVSMNYRDFCNKHDIVPYADRMDARSSFDQQTDGARSVVYSEQYPIGYFKTTFDQMKNKALREASKIQMNRVVKNFRQQMGADRRVEDRLAFSRDLSRQAEKMRCDIEDEAQHISNKGS